MVPEITQIAAVALFACGGGYLLHQGVAGYLQQRALVVRRLPGKGSWHAEGGEGNRLVLEDGMLQRFARYLTPQKAPELNSIRERMIRAGYRKPSAVRIYYTARAGFGIGLGCLAAIGAMLLGPLIPWIATLGLVFAATFIGFILPGFWITRRIQYRYQRAEEGFPDTLDLLLVCVEAGHGLDQAMKRVGTEIRMTNPTLAEELAIMGDEIRAGKERGLVFREFAKRLAVPDISAFVTVLRQSDEFGVSIADALRVYASEMRNKRVMRAEEKAHVLPTKLALGSIVFTVPPIMLIMAGPSLIMILKSFFAVGAQ